MTTVPPPGALSSPSTARNREPILRVLEDYLPPAGLVLEIAAGAGEHAAYFAAALPHLTWQPTDPNFAALGSIAAWREQAAMPNLLEPRHLDAAEPDSWPVSRADAVICINMIHISPWAATVGLMAGAGNALSNGGVLYLYGPYLEDEVETAASNLAFDASLKARDRAWGLRRLKDVAAEAAQHDLMLQARIAMPANNLSLVFRKGLTR